MPIAFDELRVAAARPRITKFADSITDARRRGVRTAFLFHSHKDAQLADGLVVLLAQHGWRLYVDWKDAEMPERPNREYRRAHSGENCGMQLLSVPRDKQLDPITMVPLGDWLCRRQESSRRHLCGAHQRLLCNLRK